MEQNTEMEAKLKDAIQTQDVLLFMKGVPEQPRCGFSMKVVEVLATYDIQYSFVDVLSTPQVRELLPSISNWPTFPQLFVNGELVGGCDIVLEMHEADELAAVFKQIKATNQDAN